MADGLRDHGPGRQVSSYGTNCTGRPFSNQEDRRGSVAPSVGERLFSPSHYLSSFERVWATASTADQSASETAWAASTT